MLDILISIGILAIFALGAIAMLYDIDCAIEEAAREALLDEAAAVDPFEVAA